MKKTSKMIYLILLLFINLSCIKQQSNEKGRNNSELVSTSKTDTLKFTSGIRAIFQDSKGNYWLGSHNEGVSYYNGKTFEYFATNEGLTDNQIRSIEQDKNGKIWFGTAKGVSVYDNGKLINYPTNLSYPRYEWNETSGNLWFNAGAEDGINRFDGINMNYLIFPKPQNKNTDNTDNTFGVTGISKDKEGKVLIATYAALIHF
jgi:ligand-binding sensor domain-containing protein